MSVIRIFLNACAVKLSDCNNIINYTSHYQIGFDKFLSFLITKSWMSKKTIKIILQESLLRHLKRSYAALISAIKINWKNETIDLANTIL